MRIGYFTMASKTWTLIQLSICLSVIINVNGQCDTNGTEILTAGSSPQYLTSPNYPANYPAHADCSWRIHAPSSNDKIIINIEDYDSESVTSDNMDLYDGYNASATLVIRMAVTNRNNLNAFVSTSDVLFITFVSDYLIQYTGFKILYFSNDTANQPGCDETLIVSESEQVLMSPNLPAAYDVSQSCSWTFSSTTGILFQIKFLDMGNCGSSYLKFYDGNSTAGVLIDTVCSTAYIYEFSDVETIVFSGHVEWTVTTPSSDYYGFMIIYRTNVVTTTSSTTTTTTTTTTTMAPSIFDYCTASGAYLTAEISPNFVFIISPQFGSRYPSNMLCRWYITAPEDYAVEASFDDETFAIESHTYCSFDYVAFYDGNSTSGSMINKVCGTLRPSSTYRSSGQQMLIIFSSDYSIEYAGFRLRLSAVDETYPGCKNGYVEYTASIPALVVPTIANSNKPYGSNQDEYFLIVNPGGTLVLQLTEINIERASGCIFDRLIIYNGPCTKDTVLDTHCGSFLKRWEITNTSTAEYLVQFHSDGSVNEEGFTMQYFLETSTTGAPTTTTTTLGPPVAAQVNLMNELLTNYSSENFPVRNLSYAVAATVDLYLAGVSSLDEVQQKLTTTMQFEITWIDENMQWPIDKLSGISKILMPQNDIWKPDLALLNSFSALHSMGSTFMFIVIENTGLCTWKPYQVLESTCQADMTNYPYDTQKCDLTFSTWSSTTAQVQTIIGTSGMQRHENFVENSEWKLEGISQRNETVNGQLTAVFTLNLKRNHVFTVFYITVPVILLSILNAFTFALPVSSGEKSGFAITVFLSFLIYVIVTFQKMPDSSDTISLFSVYLLVMTGLSNLTIIISVLEIRMIELKTKHKPLPHCTLLFTTWILNFQHKILCIKDKMGDKRHTEAEEQKNKVKQKVDDDDDDEEAEEEDNAWPDFVSALDFVCFWVFFIFSVLLAVCYMSYLATQ